MNFETFIKRFVKYAVVALSALILLEFEMSDKHITVQDVWSLGLSVLFFISLYYLSLSIVRFLFSMSYPDKNTVMTNAIGGFGDTVLISADQQQKLQETLPARARHEAAHAVAVYMLGHSVIEVSTVPDLRESSGGRCLWEEAAEHQGATLDHVVISLVGPIMDKDVHHQLPANIRHDDYVDAQRDALQVAMRSPGLTPSSVLDEGLASAQHFVEKYHKIIEMLSEQLMQRDIDGKLEPVTLSGTQVEELLAQYQEQ